jgi:hypothetical protein
LDNKHYSYPSIPHVEELVTNTKLPNYKSCWLLLNRILLSVPDFIDFVLDFIGCCFCWQVMLKNLEQVVSMILNGFQHPHPRVRWAAINAIGQLSTDLGPDLQVHYHQKVLPALANAMDDFQNPRVQVGSLILANFDLKSHILTC